MLVVVLSGVCPGVAPAAPESFLIGMRSMLEGNYADAYCRWKPLAEKGLAEAQYNLAWLYANGNGMNVDLEKAIYWWEAAAGQGHADAQFAIGLAYTTGEGLKKDLKEATEWFLQAARHGNLDAREILVRIDGQQGVNLLESHPELVHESWFGWQGETSGQKVNVRTGPGTRHNIAIQLDRKERLRVVGRQGEWYKIVLSPPNDDRVLWIYSPLVNAVK